MASRASNRIIIRTSKGVRVLHSINELPNGDLIIVTRGGGKQRTFTGTSARAFVSKDLEFLFLESAPSHEVIRYIDSMWMPARKPPLGLARPSQKV
jgi:hypothetical protein